MKTHKTFSKTVLSCLAFSLYLHAGVANANLDVSQQPLMLVDSVAPNLIFTIDDSGSMKRSHVPDTIADDNTMRTKRVKSAEFNPAYYDPDTTYIIPKVSIQTVRISTTPPVLLLPTIWASSRVSAAPI
ncbi:hypothetical protein ULF88_15520 [Halopseudomonas pachastrellae]|nr:hypothetical protein [Halopseudomonas pachastrellae]